MLPVLLKAVVVQSRSGQRMYSPDDPVNGVRIRIRSHDGICSVRPMLLEIASYQAIGLGGWSYRRHAPYQASSLICCPRKEWGSAMDEL